MSLSIDYADLPPDEYLPGGAEYRYRRCDRFRFTPSTGDLSRLPHQDYSESAEVNCLAGRCVHKSAALLDTTFENPFLHEMIRFVVRQFPIDACKLRDDWEVHVHLAESVKAQGGEFSVYDDEKKLLTSFRLEQVMDSHLFNDAILWHAANPT